MRTALFLATLVVATLVTLSMTASARAELPLTYVGRTEIHRCDGPVPLVTLIQPHVERAVLLSGKLNHSSQRTPDCLIETGTFLQEPAHDHTLFSDKLLDSAGAEPEYEEHRQAVHQNLDAPVSKRGQLMPQLIDPQNFEPRSGSAFDGMQLATP